MPEQRERIIVHVDPDLEDIVPRFLELRHEDLQAMGNSLAAGDFATLARIGHSMKGAGSGYGFDYVSEVGRAIEEAAKTQDAERVKSYAVQLLEYLERVEVVFDG